MQLTKEKNLAIISSLKDSTAALTKKQEEKRKVDAIMASIQGPQFNVDFFNKIGSLYNRVSGWCNERGKEIKEVGDNFKKGGKELGDQLNEALLGGLQSVSDSVVAVSDAISNMTWKDWKKAAISFTAGTATFAVLFVPGGGVIGAVVNGFVAGGKAGAAGSIAGDSYEVVDAIASKNQDELFKKYGVKDWAELGNRVLDQAGTSMVKDAIFGSLAAGTQEYIGAKLHSYENGVQSGNKGAGGAGTKYSPINPCDKISQEVAGSFRGATFTEKVLTEDTIMYRISGGKAGEVGSYLSKTPQGGGLQSQLDLALNPSWGNTTENVTKVIIPKGTIIYEGVAAPQNILNSLSNTIGTLPGGGNRIYIPKVEVEWFK